MIALYRHSEVLRGDSRAAGPGADGAVPRAPAGRARVQLVGRGGASVRCDRVAPARLAPAAAGGRGRARARLRSRRRLGREQRRQEAARSCASLVRADRWRPARPRRAFRRLQPMNSVVQSGCRCDCPLESLYSNQLHLLVIIPLPYAHFSVQLIH